MHTRRAAGMAPRGPLARRLLIVLALALVMTIAAAGAAVAATGHASGKGRAPAAQAGAPAADEAAENSSSPMVPLVFAGILILTLASPALPRYSRAGYYVRGERW